MNLVLTHCHKEWRAQRCLLLAYTLLVFSCLCIGLSIAPKRAWFTEGFGVHALSWFVIAGILGVLVFVTPTLVRGEMRSGGQDDQFVRRLPGALRPSFFGKLLFLGLVAVALPLLGLCVGQLFLMAWGESWDGLVGANANGYVLHWPGEAVGVALLMLLVPWVWAVGTWLPGGRMALGGCALLTLLVVLCVVPVLRQHPSLEAGIAWAWLTPFVPLLGLGAAAVSWTSGRRGGGAVRSARLGGCVLLVGMLPPSAWLAMQADRYRNPDPQQLAKIELQGITPDGRYVLARGAENAAWYGAHFRIDLHTGAAQQVAGFDRAFTGEFFRPDLWALNTASRFWRGYGEQGQQPTLLDLQTGETVAIAFDWKARQPVMAAELRERIETERRELSRLRAPGGERVWMQGTTVHFEEADGSVATHEVPELEDRLLMACGHGIAAMRDRNTLVFDFTRRRCIDVPARRHGYLVRGAFVASSEKERWQRWSQLREDGTWEHVADLDAARVLGLFDDDHLLVASEPRSGGTGGLFLYRPADRSITPIALPDVPPDSKVESAAPMFSRGSMLPRDGRGNVWVAARRATDVTFYRVDTLTRQGELVVTNGTETGRDCRVLAWPDVRSVTFVDGATIVRIDVDTGARDVLFPRP